MGLFNKKKDKEEHQDNDVLQEVSEVSEMVSQEQNTVQDDAQKSDEPEVLTADEVKELSPLYDNVIMAIKQVYDPEIPVNIYDLGLIYELIISKEHKVYIKMTFTAPNCPMADEVLNDVQTNVEDVPGIKGCSIDLVFDPVWDQSMLSDEARLELGLDDVDSMQQASAMSGKIDPGEGPDYYKEANS